MTTMPRPRPPHLCREITRHGRPVWYVRVGQGPRVRLRADYGTPAFWAEYTAAVSGGAAPPRTGPATGTLSWLIERYVESAEWTELAAATRKQRHTVYRALQAKVGDRPLKDIDQRSILATRDKLREKPHAANTFVKAMRGLYGWAMGSEAMARKVQRNPTVGVKLLAGKNDKIGFHAWTEEEVARFEGHWPIGTRQRLAFDLLLYTGLRRGDAVRLGRPHTRIVDGEHEFAIRTEKNSTLVIAPLLPRLVASIAATPTGDLTYICTERGRPFTKESFGTWFGKACRAARCPGSAHGLRKAGARRAAEDGATEAQLNALFGWADGSKESAVYTRTANRAKMAREARRPKKTNPAPSHPVRDAAPKTA